MTYSHLKHDILVLFERLGFHLLLKLNDRLVVGIVLFSRVIAGGSERVVLGLGGRHDAGSVRGGGVGAIGVRGPRDAHAAWLLRHIIPPSDEILRKARGGAFQFQGARIT